MTTKPQIPILDIVERYVDLERRGTTERPYFQGLCPMHEDTNPSFCVYPNINRAICFACCPEGVDSIGFIRRMENLSYEEAEKIATEEISNEEAFVAGLKKFDVGEKTDSVVFALRLYKLYRKKPLIEVDQVSKQIFDLLKSNQGYLANRVLLDEGV